MTDSRRTRVDERRSAHSCDRGRGQQVGEEEKGEGREDERDVQRRRKRWCMHDVKRSRERAIATARVGVGAGIGQIQGGGASRHEGREKRSRMVNEVVASEARTIIIVRRYR